VTDFHEDEAKKIKMADSKKVNFSKSPNLKKKFLKISWIGPWVSGEFDVKKIDIAQPIWS
jgi:hypothetical protein